MTRLLVSGVIAAAAVTGLSACQLRGVEPVAARAQIQRDAPVTAESVVIGAAPETDGVEGAGGERASTRAVQAYPSLTIEEVQGLEAGEARAIITPFRARVLECLPNQSGALKVRILRAGDAIRITVQPGTSLNPLQQRCVLETLSTMNFDEAWNRSSVGDKPAGFSTLLRVEF